MITKSRDELKKNKRIGDMKEVAKRLSISVQLVGNVVNLGRNDHHNILRTLEIVIEERKLRELQIKNRLLELQKQKQELEQQSPRQTS